MRLRFASSTLLATLAGLCFGVSLAAAPACLGGRKAESTRLQSSTRVAAAEGSVDTGKDANGNTRVTVAVRHLAQPERVAGGARFYVVWAKPDDGAQPQNLGTLRLDAESRGVLEAVTPLRHFQLLVTPEKETMPPAPTNDTVLRAEVHAE
jgi:hypothetical protein